MSNNQWHNWSILKHNVEEHISIPVHVLVAFFSVSGQEHNFEVANSRFFTTQGVPYDFGSIMHYKAYAF